MKMETSSSSSGGEQDPGFKGRLNRSPRTKNRRRRVSVIPLSSSESESDSEQRESLNENKSDDEHKSNSKTSSETETATCTTGKQHMICRENNEEGAMPYSSNGKQRHLKRFLQMQHPADVQRRMEHKAIIQRKVPRDSQLRTEYDKYKMDSSMITNLHLTLDVNLNNVNINLQPVYGIQDREDLTVVSPPKRRKHLSLSSTGSSTQSDNEVEEVPARRLKGCSRVDQALDRSPEVCIISDGSTEDEWTNKNKLMTGSSRQMAEGNCPPRRRASDSDVICLDSDSDSRSNKMNVSCEPITLDSQSDLEDPEYDSDSSSDSSGLPEIPLLEPMPRLAPITAGEPLASDRTAESRISFASEQRWTEKEEKSREATEVKYEEDLARSRHSSEEQGEMSDDPKVACWAFLLSAPEHMKAADQSVRKHNDCISRCFNKDKHNIISGCQEEDFMHAAVNLISDFTTTANRPSSTCLQRLFHEILKTKSTSFSEACAVFRCLKNIQHLHQPSARDFPIDWTHIQSLAKFLLQDGCHSGRAEQSSLLWHINLLALSYLVTILEDDLEKKAQWNTMKKSFAYTLLNPDTCKSQCQEVMEWLRSVVADHAADGRDPEPSCRRKGCGCTEEMCHRNYFLPLLEKLLELSLKLATVWNIREYMQKVAERLTSLGLRSLPQIQLMFETLKHDQLHLRLSELAFNAHFESEVLYNNNAVRRESVSVSRIVDDYFFYVPRATAGRGRSRDGAGSSSSSSSQEEEEEEEEQRPMRMEERMEAMVYLLLVMLQSYLKCCDGSHLARAEPTRKCAPGLHTLLPARRLSDEDQICLLQMGDHVDRLRTHATTLCGGRLTARAGVCLDQMSLLYEWL